VESYGTRCLEDEGHLKRCDILRESIDGVDLLLDELRGRRQTIVNTPFYEGIILDNDPNPFTHQLQLSCIGWVEDDDMDEEQKPEYADADWSWYEIAESHSCDTSYDEAIEDMPRYLECEEEEDGWRGTLPTVLPEIPERDLAPVPLEIPTSDCPGGREADESRRLGSGKEEFVFREPWTLGSKVVFLGALALAGGTIFAMRSYQFRQVVKGVFDHLKARS
jgi:hypothetical protein